MPVVMLWLCAVNVRAQQSASMADTVHHIQEVVVVCSPMMREVMPSQKLSGEELKRLNSQSVADALRYFSGLQIKDYGGVGGIKTVNIRSMGSSHLGIFYDGMELGNAQNGQIDLGQFSLDNVEEISLYNGQKSKIFQPASDFGSAGSIYIRTRRPRFTPGKGYNVKLKAKYGSSDMFRFSALWEQRLTLGTSLSANAEVLTASGKYKFRYRRKHADGTLAYDTTAIRQNGDIMAVRAEANVHGLLQRGSWTAKAYTYHSERGIPGAIVNNVWRRGERQWDHNTFIQAHVQTSVGDRFDTQLKAKYAYYDTRYVNNDTTLMVVDNTYRQQEFYITTSNVYEILPNWSASLSYDFKWNKLNSDMPRFAFPHRYQHMVAMATATDFSHVKLQASMLGTFVSDHVKRGTSGKRASSLTPAFFFSYLPLGNSTLSIRAFAKKSFRMPTFNDLYYTDAGNASLKPETAIQYNLGAASEKRYGSGLVRHYRIQADAYYNTIRDKIVAYPKGQQFRWTMVNLGRTHIRGVDVEAQITTAPFRDVTLTGRLQYTYQDARDVTSRKDSYYNDQIPYIPWHSGSAVVNIDYRGWSLNYSFIYAGERYNQQENIRYNYMQPWYTSDMSISYRGLLGKKMPWRLTLEVNNLLSQDYDVILNYPMPKRNYALTMDIEI